MKASQTTVDNPAPQRPLWKRLLWLVAIWAISVSTVALTAETIRLLMAAAGLREH